MSEDNYNVLVVPSKRESREQIIEDYATFALDCDTHDEFKDIMLMFYDEMVKHTKAEFLINLTELNIKKLKEMQDEIDNF